MRHLRLVLAGLLGLLLAVPVMAADPSWPKEVTFAVLSTEIGAGDRPAVGARSSRRSRRTSASR